MPSPLVVIVEHGTTKPEAKMRLERSLGRIRTEISPFVATIEQEWRDDAVFFNASALGQKISGSIAVEDRAYRVTVRLPPMLAFLGGILAPRIRERGPKLLANDPKDGSA